MATPSVTDFESAEHAYTRVRPEMEALGLDELATINVDLLSAASTVLGVIDRILPFRERMTKLPEFDVRYVDTLADYAKATWFVYVSNLPAPEPGDAAALLAEVNALRSKLLLWADPLAASGKLDPAAIAKVREGAGHKDAASDVVALVGLYRANWEAVKGICGVTEQDLARGAELAPAVFGFLSRRDFQTSPGQSDGALRVRRAWTLLDRAYGQCRRALAYLRFEEGDFDVLAPSLRRNRGPHATSDGSKTPSTDVVSGPQLPVQPTTPGASALPPAGNPIGGGSSPFGGN